MWRVESEEWSSGRNSSASLRSILRLLRRFARYTKELRGAQFLPQLHFPLFTLFLARHSFFDHQARQRNYRRKTIQNSTLHSPLSTLEKQPPQQCLRFAPEYSPIIAALCAIYIETARRAVSSATPLHSSLFFLPGTVSLITKQGIEINYRRRTIQNSTLHSPLSTL